MEQEQKMCGELPGFSRQFELVNNSSSFLYKYYLVWVYNKKFNKIIVRIKEKRNDILVIIDIYVFL